MLGTAGAVSSGRRTSTSLAFSAGESLLLVECSGDAVSRLAAAGFEWTALEHVLVSHGHVDHIAGLPALVHQIHVSTRGRPGVLHVLGPEAALTAAEGLLSAVALVGRKDPEVRLEPLPLARSAFEVGELEVTTFPVSHGLVPTLGARVSSRSAAAVYSADTEPCEAVLEQAKGALMVVHECSALGDEPLAGHTCLGQIEELCPRLEARVRLVHLPPVSDAEERAVAERLKGRFGARVALATELGIEPLFTVP